MFNEVVYSPNFEDLINRIFPGLNLDNKVLAPKTTYLPTLDTIPISRVIYSGNATTVYFVDGTKTTVYCSPNDHYDRQTAIAYALIKRLFGKVGVTDKNGKFHANEIDGNGIGIKLAKIADAGYDQDLEEKLAKDRKLKAKQQHEATQKAQSEAAWNRKVAKRAEQIRLEREANALVDSLTKTNDKKIINESVEHENAPDSKSILKTYKKPNKKFKDFTQAEKREYWSYHNAKRQAKNNY